MKQIEEQEKIVASVYDDARTKDHQLTEQGSKIKHLERELQLIKTTKAVDTLAPKHVYSGKAASSDTMKKQENETKTNKLPCLQQPQFPKLSTYDENNDWKSYYLQFEDTANRFEWNEEQKLDNCLLCLRGKALKFFSTRPVSIQKYFDQLMEKMNQRFGKKDLTHSIRRELQEVKQNLDESIEEYAERVKEMATYGHIDAPEDIIELMAVDAFLISCIDQKRLLFQQ